MQQPTQIDIAALKYKLTGIVATEWKQVESMCNCITFINTGTQNVVISPVAVTLYPGQQFVGAGDTGEIDTTQYSVSFTPGAAGTYPSVTIIRKTYQ